MATAVVMHRKVQALVPPVTVNVFVPAAVGVPLPVKRIVWAPVAANVPVPLKVIPFTAGAVVTLQVPTVVTVTLSVIVFAAVSAVPATYVPTGVAPVQLKVNAAVPPVGGGGAVTVTVKSQTVPLYVTLKLFVPMTNVFPPPTSRTVCVPVAPNVPVALK